MMHYTESGVRLTERTHQPGHLNWLFLPGGPGLGSESLAGLVDLLDLPGTSWLVDLPGDGSNINGPGIADDPFRCWPQVLVEAAAVVPNPVFVGHSTGGMYVLATPELESLLVGLVLVSAAPDASWLPAFVRMTEGHPLAEVDAASAAFAADPSDATLGALAVASAPWTFGAQTAAAGAAFLATMPHNGAAVAWSEENFDHDYVHTWWPIHLPTLIVSGADDRIVIQTLWDKAEFAGANVSQAWIDGGGHFPWFENPGAVRRAFRSFSQSL